MTNKNKQEETIQKELDKVNFLLELSKELKERTFMKDFLNCEDVKRLIIS